MLVLLWPGECLYAARELCKGPVQEHAPTCLLQLSGQSAWSAETSLEEEKEAARLWDRDSSLFGQAGCGVETFLPEKEGQIQRGGVYTWL